MRDAIVNYLPWLLSCITIWMTLLAGDKNPRAWEIGLANQVLWLVWIGASMNWGFLPLNVALWGVYLRNHIIWKNA